MKTRKNVTGAHASCTFRKWAKCQNDLKPTNAKNAIENEKKYNRATCLALTKILEGTMLEPHFADVIRTTYILSCLSRPDLACEL